MIRQCSGKFNAPGRLYGKFFIVSCIFAFCGQVIELLQSHGLVVGMCGDGGNDCGFEKIEKTQNSHDFDTILMKISFPSIEFCIFLTYIIFLLGALRAAHFGLALSEGDASLVSPFSTNATSLTQIVLCLRWGRATLETNLATIRFFLVCGWTLVVGKLLGGALTNASFTEAQYLLMDFGIHMSLAMAMVRSKPEKTLSAIRPTGTFFSIRSIVFLVPFFLATVLMYVLELWFVSTRSYYKIATIQDMLGETYAYMWYRKGDSYVVMISFWILVNIDVCAGMAFTFGSVHRQIVLKNYWTVGISAALLTVIGVGLFGAFAGPGALHCMFRMNCDSRTSLDMQDSLWSWFTRSGPGDCFYSGHVADWKSLLGDQFKPPFPHNQCHLDNAEYPEVLFPPADFEGSNDWGPFLGSNCVGPHNCLDGYTKAVLFFMTILICGASVVSVWLTNRMHPRAKIHFLRY